MPAHSRVSATLGNLGAGLAVVVVRNYGLAPVTVDLGPDVEIDGGGLLPPGEAWLLEPGIVDKITMSITAAERPGHVDVGVLAIPKGWAPVPGTPSKPKADPLALAVEVATGLKTPLDVALRGRLNPAQFAEYVAAVKVLTTPEPKRKVRVPFRDPKTGLITSVEEREV